jgi:uncharacterized protein YhaN
VQYLLDHSVAFAALLAAVGTLIVQVSPRLKDFLSGRAAAAKEAMETTDAIRLRFEQEMQRTIDGLRSENKVLQAQVVSVTERAAAAEARAEGLKTRFEDKLTSIGLDTKETHTLVNSQREALLAKIEELTQQVQRLEEAAAEALRPKPAGGTP